MANAKRISPPPPRNVALSRCAASYNEHHQFRTHQPHASKQAVSRQDYPHARMPEMKTMQEAKRGTCRECVRVLRYSSQLSNGIIFNPSIIKCVLAHPIISHPLSSSHSHQPTAERASQSTSRQNTPLRVVALDTCCCRVVFSVWSCRDVTSPNPTDVLTCTEIDILRRY